jgi:hypothetical protein
MVPGTLEAGLLGLDAAHIGRMPPEEYYAAVLERICHAAVQHCRASAGMLVNYRQLPEIVWSSLLDFFQIPHTEADIERMRRVTQFHAKNPALYFAEDTAAKQSAATDRLRQIAHQRLKPLYEQLEQLRQVHQEV